jgi:hypothetical protein
MSIQNKLVLFHFMVHVKFRSPWRNTVKPELTTICLQRPQYLIPNVGLYNINLPLNNDHLSTTATNLGSQGWSLYFQKKNFTRRTGYTSGSFISGLPSGFAQPSVSHIVYGRTIRNKFPDLPIYSIFHAEVGRWPAVEFLVEVMFGIANYNE